MCVLRLLLHWYMKKRGKKESEENDDKIYNSFYVLAAQHMLLHTIHLLIFISPLNKKRKRENADKLKINVDFPPLQYWRVEIFLWKVFEMLAIIKEINLYGKNRNFSRFTIGCSPYLIAMSFSWNYIMKVKRNFFMSKLNMSHKSWRNKFIKLFIKETLIYGYFHEL